MPLANYDWCRRTQRLVALGRYQHDYGRHGSGDDHEYIGLTPGSSGSTQADFNVPQIAKGTYLWSSPSPEPHRTRLADPLRSL